MHQTRVKFRLAKKSDASDLASIHIECGFQQVGGFMHKLGRLFLAKYYDLFLREPGSVILLAVGSDDKALGFSSGTVDASEHFSSLRRNRVILVLTMIPALIKSPPLLREVLLRRRAIEGMCQFGSTSGPRGEYWAWRPTVKDPAAALVLRKRWCDLMRALGCRKFQFELDVGNSDVNKYIDLFGSRVVQQIVLPDGRRRMIMEEDLSVGRSRIK